MEWIAESTSKYPPVHSQIFLFKVEWITEFIGQYPTVRSQAVEDEELNISGNFKLELLV